MKLSLSSQWVKRSLAGHSWIGLLVGGLMYVVCLTGTLCVFYPQLERWEQPRVAESLSYDPLALERAANTLAGDPSRRTEHLYVTLPTEDTPRLAVANEERGWFVNPDGSLGGPMEHDWTHFLIDMHLYLTLPESIGIILVSSLGAMLVALIVSGLLAHPRIFKDAFHLRLRGGGRLQQTDIHNRLSVWGVPFYLLIAVTGAYFGLVMPLLGLVSGMTGRDAKALADSVFGAEPVVQAAGPLHLAAALDRLAVIDPRAEPIGMTVYGAGTQRQSLEIYARQPGRMIYSENYRFDSEGRYLGKVGFSDGEVGKQVVYSMYYLHFGHFAGFASKLIYGILGMALTVISVTGINIWLAKRRQRDALHDLWVGFVWGVPIALTGSAALEVGARFLSPAVFWVIVAGCVAWALRRRDEVRSRRDLLWTLAATTLLLLAVHAARFGAASASPAAIVINAGLLLQLSLVVAYLFRGTPAAAAIPTARLAEEPQLS